MKVRVGVLVLAIACTIVVTIYAAVFDTSEFRGLGFTMIHLVFITPVLLLGPLLTHINVPQAERRRLWLLNGAVVAGLAVSWIVLTSR